MFKGPFTYRRLSSGARWCRPTVKWGLTVGGVRTSTVAGVYLPSHAVNCLVGFPNAPPLQRHVLTVKLLEFRAVGNEVNTCILSIGE